MPVPLSIRSLQLAMAYWTNLKGHEETHITRKVLIECWEYGRTKVSSFGWEGNKQAKEMGIEDIPCSKTISIPVIPPWHYSCPIVHLETKDKVKNREDVQRYLDIMHGDKVQIYTDGSKDANGQTGAGVFIPKYEINIKKRTSDHLAVFSVEMMAILLALEWVEETKKDRVIICTYSVSSV